MYNSPLSERQLQILQLLAEGYFRKEIAAELDLSFETIRNHLTTIYARLGTERAAEAVAKGIRSGWLI